LPGWQRGDGADLTAPKPEVASAAGPLLSLSKPAASPSGDGTRGRRPAAAAPIAGAEQAAGEGGDPAADIIARNSANDVVRGLGGQPLEHQPEQRPVEMAGVYHSIVGAMFRALT
jgi:hypothetical protein